MAKLRAHKIDVDDAATLEKLSQIYGNYQNPEAFLKAARAGTGELRVLVRASKMPGVKCVRFLRPARGTVTPDIEVEMRDGRRTYVEVRTLTQAPDWAQIKDRARRRPESIVFISSVEEKIRLGQISRSRPGILVIHAPFQKVTSTSLEGWRDVLNDIRSRGPFPAGLARIEISGGSGGGLLIFQPRDWKGVIVE
jgi:hypothetical protein